MFATQYSSIELFITFIMIIFATEKNDGHQRITTSSTEQSPVGSLSVVSTTEEGESLSFA